MINHSVRFNPYDRSGAYPKKIWDEANMMYHYRRLVFLSLLLTFGYAAFFIGQGSASADSWQKVTFDISRPENLGYV
jgi:hypothetical protein